MNTREKFEFILVENGMFPEQAKKVMDVAIPEINASNEYQITWDRPEQEYPEVFYSSVWVIQLKVIALKWIDENIPRAWYRPMFVYGA